MRRIAPFVFAFALVAAACGDSGGGSDGGELSGGEQTLADVIRDEILEDNDPDSPLGLTEAQCVGDEAVREFGIDGLVELGYTTEGESPDGILENATSEQRQTIIDVTLRCVDFAEVLVQEIAADGSISEDSARCIGDGLEEGGLLEALVVSGLEGTSFEEQDPEVASAFLNIFLECLTAEELGNLGNG